MKECLLAEVLAGRGLSPADEAQLRAINVIVRTRSHRLEPPYDDLVAMLIIAIPVYSTRRANEKLYIQPTSAPELLVYDLSRPGSDTLVMTDSVHFSKRF